MDQARSLPERREAALERLRVGGNMWLATASDGRGPHLIPLSYWWDGSRLVTATSASSRTVTNVKEQPKVRASIGETGDVVMIDATTTVVPVADIAEEAADGYARMAGWDPRSVPGSVYLHLTPQRIQVWRGPAEVADRTVMRGGTWLDHPND